MTTGPQAAYRLWSWRTLEEVAFPALTFLFGIQFLRLLLNGLIFYLRDALGAPTITSSFYAFGLFLVIFLAVALPRLLALRSVLGVTAGGLATARLAEQFVTSPPVDLALSLTTEAVALFGGADRRVMGVYAFLQALLPLLAFAAALALPAWLYRDRRALRGTS